MDKKILDELVKTLEKDKKRFLFLKEENDRLKKRIKELVKMIAFDKRFFTTIEQLEEEIENIKNPSRKYTYSYEKGGMIPKKGAKIDDQTKKLEEINGKLRRIVYTLEKMGTS